MVKIDLHGTEATINGLEWTCQDKDLLPILETFIEKDGYSPADPDPDFTVATEVVKAMQGKITEHEPPTHNPDLVY